MTSRIGILGAGAIGQLLCWQLRHHQPILLGRQAAPDCFIHTDLDGQRHRFSPQYRQLNDKKLSDIGLLIVTVKAYQVMDALLPLLSSLSADCAVLLLHNGMGPHLQLAPVLQGRDLLLGTTSQGALREASGRDCWHVRHTGTGLTQIGLLNGNPARSKSRVQPLLDAIANAEWTEDILMALWQKLAVNAAINPLTAIHNCRNGELATAGHCATIQAIVAELVTTAAADGIILDESALLARVYQVITLTANNFSSMHQDVAHGRQTEIDAINGFVVSRAEALGIDTPYHRDMMAKVRALGSVQ
ncbi:ketopantoate reductase family protein [Shewanella sp. GXUN23E]|uniref:ketopantoate reductase family protein n=1 Tax=Shewanella sp. GXUN23E TaxID=3422498 RepID=UPI003D7D28A6